MSPSSVFPGFHTGRSHHPSPSQGWWDGESRTYWKVEDEDITQYSPGVGVFRRTQGSLQGRHDGQSAAPHITGWIQSWEPTREMSPSSVFPGFPTGRSHHPSPSQVDESSHGNPPERCPRPLYSRDSTQEGHTIPHHHQGEDLMKMKVEGEVEETYVRDDQQYTEEAGMMRTFKEEDTPTEISTGETQYILLLSLLCYCTLI
ncbi:unnamed protein product, partial [Staurois parvus]